MGFFSRLFGTRARPAGPDSPAGSEDAAVSALLIRLIRQQLLTSGVPSAADLTVEGPGLMTRDRRLAVTVEVREVTADKVHAHVISWLPNAAVAGGSDVLDACVMGYGSTEPATEQVAEVWLRLVGAPVLSYLSGRVVLDADHFGSGEEWGVPGGHGFVGPFMVRGEDAAVDPGLLARCEAFRFDGYARDGRRHLVKVTLVGRDGRWKRYLEIDGHTATHVDEEWQSSLPPPRAPVMCVRFAVFDMID